MTLSLSGGFAFLPFLWLVNVVWFFKEAFVKPTYTEQLQIKTCEYTDEVL
jgi:presenilin enhancer 2